MGGDLFLKIRVKRNEKFRREGENLKLDQPVDLFTALLGGETQVSTFDKTVKLTIPPGTDSGKTFRLSGLGMPQLGEPTKRGDLYVTVEIKLPKDLSEEQKQKFLEIKRMRQ